MTYSFRPAERSQAKPLIGLYSESGCGKTYSALLIARGFVGPSGKIGMIETESGRGEAYADVREYPEIGGYDVLPLRDSFSPESYGKAITAAEQVKLDALIIDSASHEWEGAGGVLSLAAARQAAGTKGVLAWQAPKLDHQRHFMLRFMQTSIPLVILCMRAKYPMEEITERNEKKWVRSKVLEPKQADDILFEMFVHGWIDGSHNFHLTKSTAKALGPVFQSDKPLSLETGRALAAWAKSASKPAEKINTPSNEDGKSSVPQPKPGEDPDYDKSVSARAELIVRAELAANGGVREYRDFWQSLSSTDKDRVGKAEHEKFVVAAKASDEAVA